MFINKLTSYVDNNNVSLTPTCLSPELQSPVLAVSHAVLDATSLLRVVPSPQHFSHWLTSDWRFSHASALTPRRSDRQSVVSRLETLRESSLTYKFRMTVSSLVQRIELLRTNQTGVQNSFRHPTCTHSACVVHREHASGQRQPAIAHDACFVKTC